MSRQRHFTLPDGSKTNDIHVFSSAMKPERKPVNKVKLGIAAALAVILTYLLWPETMEQCTRKAAQSAQGSTTAFQVMLDICRKKHTR